MKSINPTFLVENGHWLSGAPKQKFYLYLELQGAAAPVHTNRVPLNLSIVVDRSGSMQGNKITYAKKAAQFVVDNLMPNDRLSVVQYDDEINVVSPFGAVQNKVELRRRIEMISARGATNLSGGLLKGYEQAGLNKLDRYVNRVLLLSDGLANRGITDQAMLQNIVQEKFREEGIALSTFGIGADFDELLMTNLSEYGGANYYFIDSPDKIPSIFAKELKGLLAVVAQNVKLEIRLPSAYFSCEKVYGFPAEISTEVIQIPFNDLFSSEKNAVLLELNAVRPPDQDLEFAVCLRYDNVLGEYQQVLEEQVLKVQLTSDADAVEAGTNRVVLEQTTFFTANQWYEEVILLAERGDYHGAKNLITQIKAYLEKHFQNMTPTEELKKQYEEVVRYEQLLPEMERMSQRQQRMVSKASRASSYASRRKSNF